MSTCTILLYSSKFSLMLKACSLFFLLWPILFLIYSNTRATYQRLEFFLLIHLFLWIQCRMEILNVKNKVAKTTIWERSVYVSTLAFKTYFHLANKFHHSPKSKLFINPRCLLLILINKQLEYFRKFLEVRYWSRVFCGRSSILRILACKNYAVTVVSTRIPIWSTCKQYNKEFRL